MIIGITKEHQRILRQWEIIASSIQDLQIDCAKQEDSTSIYGNCTYGRSIWTKTERQPPLDSSYGNCSLRINCCGRIRQIIPMSGMIVTSIFSTFQSTKRRKLSEERRVKIRNSIARFRELKDLKVITDLQFGLIKKKYWDKDKKLFYRSLIRIQKRIVSRKFRSGRTILPNKDCRQYLLGSYLPPKQILNSRLAGTLVGLIIKR